MASKKKIETAPFEGEGGAVETVAEKAERGPSAMYLVLPESLGAACDHWAKALRRPASDVRGWVREDLLLRVASELADPNYVQGVAQREINKAFETPLPV